MLRAGEMTPLRRFSSPDHLWTWPPKAPARVPVLEGGLPAGVRFGESQSNTKPFSRNFSAQISFSRARTAFGTPKVAVVSGAYLPIPLICARDFQGNHLLDLSEVKRSTNT
jgi:hypothetical protein